MFTNKGKTTRLNTETSPATLVGLNCVGHVIWASIVFPSEFPAIIEKFGLKKEVAA